MAFTCAAMLPKNTTAVAILFQSTRPRGARHLCNSVQFFLHIVSIHAPTWGATGGRSRTCEAVKVSIHAPTWGATLLDKADTQSVYRFQSTRPRGARPNITTKTQNKYMFQSTRPRGARHGLMSLHKRKATSFNPRAHVGRDLHNCGQFLLRKNVSIHAPTWGAT